MPRLFVFGVGYSAEAIARLLMLEGWTVAGTCRTQDGADKLTRLGIAPILFDGSAPISPSAFKGTTHLLASIPADPDDPALRHHVGDIAAIEGLEWVGYLSTTSVYGVTDGSTVDEETPCDPSSARGQRRLAAERAWQALPLPGHVFRLSGIYGPPAAASSTRSAPARRSGSSSRARPSTVSMSTTSPPSSAPPSPRLRPAGSITSPTICRPRQPIW